MSEPDPATPSTTTEHAPRPGMLPEDVYGAWMTRAKFTRRGGGGMRSVDEAPPDMEDLRHYFVGLSDRQLARCWVAAVADASQRPFRIGDISRALIVVAKRLHGLRFADAEPARPAADMVVPSMPQSVEPVFEPEPVMTRERSRAFELRLARRRRQPVCIEHPNGEKMCTKCRVVKALGEFSRRTVSADGLTYWCKGCTADYQKGRTKAGG